MIRWLQPTYLNAAVCIMCRVSVNFGLALTTMMREARYLDRMGFTIPDLVLNVALQEDKYHQCVEGITTMLDTYYKVMPFTPIHTHQSRAAWRYVLFVFITHHQVESLNINRVQFSDKELACTQCGEK